MSQLPLAQHAAALDEPNPLETATLPGETLAQGVFLLLALTVLQRAVGFVREIFFCRTLDAQQLGQWDMAFGFLMLAAPLAVLSLPGAFGRYVEHYRQQGQLRRFLRETALCCVGLALPALTMLYFARQWFAQLIFGSRAQAGMVILLVASLVVVIAFNSFISLFTAMRNMRVVSRMELTNSLMFAVLAVGLMLAWRPTAASAVVAYAGACFVNVLGSLWRLARAWPTLDEPRAAGAAVVRGQLWSRVFPFALWIMATNFLSNLFDVIDRYMIVHCSAGTAAEALAEVGNYRSSRVVPLLLASITAMIATVATPHLSHDWECGRRGRVSARLNLLLKLLGGGLTAAAVLVLWVAPLLFQFGFRGKFAGGLAVLPWTLTYCTWCGLAVVAQKYLWCAEKAHLVGVPIILGLIANVALNFLLMPRLGLQGAVLATAAANLVALALIMLVSRRAGFAVDRGAWIMLALPAIVPLGPWLATAALVVVALEIATANRLFSAAEKAELTAGALEYVERFLSGWTHGGRQKEKGKSQKDWMLTSS
jgi:polysaccharide transporter, PST family